MLTDAQTARWQRARQKGRSRVLLEQWLTWTVGVGMGGPTLRAALKGGWNAVRAYWSGEAAPLHLVLALLFGAVMTYIFGLLSWNRMERLYAESLAATARGSKDPGGRSPDPNVNESRRRR